MFLIAQETGYPFIDDLCERLSWSEALEWNSWFEIKAKAEKKAIDDAKRGAKSSPARRGGGKRWR